jgi:hypothetical protein
MIILESLPGRQRRLDSMALRPLGIRGQEDFLFCIYQKNGDGLESRSYKAWGYAGDRPYLDDILHIPTNYALLVRASSTAGEGGSNSLRSDLWGVEMGELSNTEPVSIEAMPPHRRRIALLTGQKSRS